MSFSNDDQELQRYVDGELSEADAAAFAARMLADNDLRQRVEAMEQIHLGFASARDHASGPDRAPAGFTASVMSEVRRLPGREQLQQMDVGEGLVRLCRGLLLAAGILIGLGLCWQSGLFRSTGSGSVEAASPAEIEAEMKRLDDMAFKASSAVSPATGTEAPRRGK